MSNPFHYFAPFKNTREDRKKFFGRQEEESELVNIFRKSPVTVVTGPSGSGKTSLIECGLFQRLRILDHEVTKIRFDKDEHIGSNLIKLFTSWNQELANIFSLMLRNHAKPNELRFFLRSDADEKLFLEILQNNNESEKLGALLDKENLPLLSEVMLEEIEKNKNGYDYNYKEDVQDLLKNSIKIAFDKHLRGLANKEWGGKRYLLFDQFEEFYSLKGYSDLKKQHGFEIEDEYFVLTEIDAIGLFISTVIDRLSSINIIISFKEEFLGSFDAFSKWIPNLHRRKYRISLPDKDELEIGILSLYFEKFNIEAEEGVMEHVLQEVKKIGATQQYQLPFMQMYLFELYEYAIAAKHEKDGNVLLKSVGIKKYRSIKDIVRQKVNRLSIRLRNKVKSEKSKSITIGDVRDFILRILKEFKTEGDSKRRYRFIDDEIIDFELRGIDQNNALIEYIPYCTMELVNEKLIRYEEEDQYLELAHDTLSEIIDQFGITKDYMEILQENFDSSFELYQSSKSSENETHLISKSFMSRISRDDYKTLITEKDGTINSEKQKFWLKSYSHDKAKEIRNKWIRIGVFACLFIALCFSIYFLLDSKLSNVSEGKAKANSEQHQKTSIVESEILKALGNAYAEGKNDLTKAYKAKKFDNINIDSLIAIKESYEKTKVWDALLDFKLFDKVKTSAIQASIKARVDEILSNIDEQDKYAMRREYFEEIEGNLDKRPFYLKSINLPDNHHIESTKTRNLNRSEDTLIIYSLTHDYLRQDNFLFNDTISTKVNSLPGVISAFEPFYRNGSSKVLVSINDSLVLLNNKLEIEESMAFKNNFDIIEQIGDDSFLCQTSDKTYLFNVNSITGKYDTFTNHIGSFESKEIRLISYLKDYEEVIFQVRTSLNENKIFKWNIREKKMFGIRINDIQSIKNIKVQKNGDILLSDASSIYKISRKDIYSEDRVLKLPPPLIVHGDDENWEIRTIDSDGDKIIVGTQGSIAQVYYNEGRTYKTAIRRQKLIGHKDDILNVSFVRGGDFALTSSHGGSIKIWNLKDLAQAEERVKIGNNGISKLKFRDSTLYVGFRRIKPTDSHDPGYILELDEDLDSTLQKYYYRGRSSIKNIEIPNFDIEQNGSIVAGTYWNKRIINAQFDGSGVESIKFATEGTVRDIRIQDSIMVVATDKGIEIFKKRDSTYLKQILGGENDIQINAVDINLKLNKVIAAGENANIYVWDLKGPSLDTILHAHHDKVSDVCFSEDGRYFVSGSWDNKAIVWYDLDSINYKQIPLKVHNSDIEDIDISDNIVATASSDNSVQLHEIFVGKDALRAKRLTSLINHNVSIRAVAFGANNNIIYTGDKNGHIKKWDISEFPPK